jgi:8-oxo-dGTP pyrophosphatase MutT (NUDIX family)
MPALIFRIWTECRGRFGQRTALKTFTGSCTAGKTVFCDTFEASIMSTLFNVRVYGIVLNKQQEVLLSEEQYGKHHFVKFPGGGLDYGEGTIECMHREFEEELGLRIKSCTHFYTTDFFQKSMMDDTQIISIYYIVELEQGQEIPAHSDTGILYFHPIDESLETRLSLPIDKVVGRMLADIK